MVVLIFDSAVMLIDYNIYAHIVQYIPTNYTTFKFFNLFYFMKNIYEFKFILSIFCCSFIQFVIYNNSIESHKHFNVRKTYLKYYFKEYILKTKIFIIKSICFFWCKSKIHTIIKIFMFYLLL